MIIYRIKNKNNGKIYIGQTTRSMEARWKGHCRSAGKSNNNLFHNAISKYGKENFEIEELAKADSMDQLNKLEILFVELNNSLYPNGYNLKTGGTCGVVYTDHVKDKMSKAKLGTSVPEEVREKMSKTHKDNWAKNKTELSKKRSEMVKKAWKDPDYRDKISKARKNYWSNNDNRISASKRGKIMASDSNYIDKVSKGVKIAHQRKDVKIKMKEHYNKQKKAIIDSSGVVYSSIKEAAAKLKIMPSNIVKALKGDYKTAGGYTWSYTNRKKSPKELDEAFQSKRLNPDPNQLTLYIVSGIAGSGKSWVCNQLDSQKFNYVSYDKNRKKTHLDLLRNLPKDKIAIYDLNIKTSTFIRRHHQEFNIHFVTVLGDFITVKQQLISRGGKVTKGTYKRWKVMKKRAQQYADFSGSSEEVLTYLKSINV